MDQALNVIAHRDGVARRRWALGYHPQFVDGSTAALAPEPPNMVAVEDYSANGSIDDRPLYQWGFKDCGDLLRYVTGSTPMNVVMSQGINLRLFNSQGNYQTITSDGADRSGWYVALTTYGWDNFNAGPIEFELLDTSTPDDQGGYRELWIANGRSVIQLWRGGAETIPIAITGLDGFTADAVQRSRIVRRFKDTMLYVCDGFPNFIFYSRPLTSGGFYDFDQLGDNYFVHIDSGLDSPITNLVQFGDLMYVFTKKAIWRMQYGSSSFPVEWVMDVGCPSQQGVVMIGSVGAGSEQVSGPGSMMFVTHQRSIMVSDGMTSMDVSEPVRDILDRLTDYQVEHMRAVKWTPLGIVAFVWPSHDLTRTEGLAFDVHDNNWIGELRYDLPSDSVGHINGEACLGIRSPNLNGTATDDDCRIVVGAGVIPADVNREYSVAGAVKMQEDGVHDLVWDFLYTAAAADYNIRGTGLPIREEFRTPDMDFDNPFTAKVLSNLFFDLEPTGDWNITALVFSDWKNQGVGNSIPVIGNWIGRDDPIMEALGAFTFDSDIAYPFDKLVTRGHVNSRAHAHAIGLRHEPSRTAVTINGSDYNVADPGGFNVRSIAVYVENAQQNGPSCGPTKTAETP